MNDPMNNAKATETLCRSIGQFRLAWTVQMVKRRTRQKFIDNWLTGTGKHIQIKRKTNDFTSGVTIIQGETGIAS